MRYLALDNALVTTGWSIFEDKELIDYNHFTIPANKIIHQRLGKYWDSLNDLYQNFKFDFLFFEDCQNQGNAQTYHKLSMVKGVILLWCFCNNMDYQILSPSHWRRVLTNQYKCKFGKVRKEQKEKAQELVKQIYNTSPLEDECDAICLGLAGIIENEKPKSAF